MNRWMRFLMVIALLGLSLSCASGGSDPLPKVTPTPRLNSPIGAEPDPTEETDSEDVAPIVPVVNPPAPGDARGIRQSLLRSTVQIVALKEEKHQLQPLWTGSGTILTPDGLILTNAHVASDVDPDYRPDALGIAITVRSDDVPDLRYLAEVVAIDYDLDLAVIQIISDLDGKQVNTARLNLPYTPIGDSDLLELGDVLEILGYPGIGGETITLTEGVVSGFTRERGVKGRAYIKTDATIAGGNSGGMAANARGELIGVPTQVGYGGAERFADCRYLADTNNDGEIDEDDNCIPVGGFINAIRPVNLARPLIESARMGLMPEPGAEVTPYPEKTPEPEATPEETPAAPQARFYNLVFAPAVTENDQPTQVITQLSDDATELFAHWSYKALADGVEWEARWYLDGEYQEGVSWTPAPWKGGEQGTWWVSVSNDDGLVQGRYKLELYVEGQLLAENEITVGGQAQASGPAFTDLVFAAAITADDQPVDPGYLIPSGSTTVYAFFSFSGMEDGMEWERRWYYEGESLAEKQQTWDQGNAGQTWVNLRSEDPLDPGVYRLELYADGALLAAMEFTIAGTQEQQAIGAITFAAGADDDAQPVNAAAEFGAGLVELHFFFEYAGMRDGMKFREQWYFDGEELYAVDLDWSYGASGSFHDNLHRKSREALWEGEYKLELYVEGQLVQSAVTRIGGDAQSNPLPTAATGMQIQGYIVDADTGDGIPGAQYVVLNPGVSIKNWQGDKNKIYTQATADDNGYFELPRALERGQTYSVVVMAENYKPVKTNRLAVGDEPSPQEVQVELQQE